MEAAIGSSLVNRERRPASLDSPDQANLACQPRPRAMNDGRHTSAIFSTRASIMKLPSGQCPVVTATSWDLLARFVGNQADSHGLLLIDPGDCAAVRDLPDRDGVVNATSPGTYP